MNRIPAISIIIPTRNSAPTLLACLKAIERSTVVAHEIIVVDDGSSDGSGEIAEAEGVILVKLNGNRHANYCRNVGAEHASGDILLFLDSDVVLQPDTIRNALDSLSNGRCDVVVGLYSDRHVHPNVASQYKNLWIRYSYLRSRENVDWIFGAIALIRKQAFHNAGGFDRTLFRNKGGDLELGKRITDVHPSIVLNPRVEVEHLKKHVLTTLLRNDFDRAQGFLQLAGRLGQLSRSLFKGFANVYPAFVYSSAIVWLMLLSLMAGVWIPSVLWSAIGFSILYLILNADFLLYYARHRGYDKMPQVLGVMVLDHLACGAGSLMGLSRWLFSR